MNGYQSFSMDAYPIKTLLGVSFWLLFEDFIVFFYNCFRDWI